MRGQGYFEWQVTINGRCHLKCDGAVSSTPTAVTIWNVRKGSTIELVLRAHRDSPRLAWENASRIAARDIHFRRGEANGNKLTKVTSDNRLAHVLTSDDIHSDSEG